MQAPDAKSRRKERPSTVLSLRFPCSFLFQILPHAELHDPADESIGNGLIEWKTKVAFLSGIDRDPLHELAVPSNWRVEADVRLESGKVDKDAVKRECRHAIADRFLRVWRRSPYGCPYLLQDRLDSRRKCRDVLIDVRGCQVIRSQFIPPPVISDRIFRREWLIPALPTRNRMHRSSGHCWCPGFAYRIPGHRR